MRDPFARATTSILGRLGKDALLRGQPAGRVHIEHGVEIYERNAEGEAVFSRSVATIESVYNPKQGDTLALFEADGTPILPTYRLGQLHAETGYSRRHIVVAA